MYTLMTLAAFMSGLALGLAVKVAQGQGYAIVFECIAVIGAIIAADEAAEEWMP